MLIKCPECELNVSDKALACPHCGCPMKQNIKQPASRTNRNKRRRLPNGFGQISEIKGQHLRKPFRAMVTVGKEDNGRPICKLLKPDAYFETYNEAYSALVAYNKNPYSLDPAITVQELYGQWSTKYFETLKSNSITSIKNTWRYCWPVYTMQVKDLRTYHIKGCMEEGSVNKNGIVQKASSNEKGRIKSLFNLMLDYALEYEIVDRNYARAFHLSDDLISDMSTAKKPHIPFTDIEMEKLWSNVNTEPYADIILIQCYSGWRPQELGLIETEHVDLEHKLFTGGMKTEAGENRLVPIHSRIFELVAKYYAESKSKNRKFLFSHVGWGGAVKPLTYEVYRYRFAKVIKDLGLNPEHRPHDPRKHFVTKAKEYKMDEYAIKYIVGHAITDITERIYTDRNVSWLYEEMQKIK